MRDEKKAVAARGSAPYPLFIPDGAIPKSVTRHQRRVASAHSPRAERSLPAR